MAERAFRIFAVRCYWVLDSTNNVTRLGPKICTGQDNRQNNSIPGEYGSLEWMNRGQGKYMPPMERKPDNKCMIRGQAKYMPLLEIDVITKRIAYSLDVNEAIRNLKSRKIRAIEEPFSSIKNLLSQDRDPLVDRNKCASNGGSKTTRDVLRVPPIAAVQIYDYEEKKARVVFGPEMMMLGPDEQLRLLSLSGGRPKVPNQIRSLCLLLGLFYNWHFEVADLNNGPKTSKLFITPCKAIASRTRGNVVASQFDDVHKNSARIIRMAMFRMDEIMKVNETFKFLQNELVITSIDVQAVEPVDQRTRDALQKSVQLAIEITTNSQEATARHEATEKARRNQLKLQAESDAVMSTGQANALSTVKIEAVTAFEQADYKRKAQTIASDQEERRPGDKSSRGPAGSIPPPRNQPRPMNMSSKKLQANNYEAQNLVEAGPSVQNKPAYDTCTSKHAQAHISHLFNPRKECFRSVEKAGKRKICKYDETCSHFGHYCSIPAHGKAKVQFNKIICRKSHKTLRLLITAAEAFDLVVAFHLLLNFV